MNVKRLTKLADYLEAYARIPKKERDVKWDMTRWMDESPECGTSACALGHATLIPSFKRAGLKTLESDGCDCEVCRGHNGSISAYITHIVEFRGQSGVSAGADFFGISYANAANLFSGSNMTPLQKAKQIRKLIKAYADAR